ncbi:leucine-rich repeat neuronal protein 4 [Amia ocellicauda]|uniref:leucine-rich repeat neuronal protein 4 n=1 Tax=Amia ocellicauda TaxID=2972642 RepID=UPI003463B1EB
MHLILRSVLIISVVWEAGCQRTADAITCGKQMSLTLDLSDRNLTSRHFSCGVLSNFKIESLLLSSNSLEEIPSCLPPTLRRLDLSKNNISTLTDHSLQGLTNLQVLILDDNYIRRVSLQTPVNLKILSLINNTLQEFPETPQWPRLEHLSVSNNQMTVFNVSYLQAFPALRFLYLTGNHVNLNFSAPPYWHILTTSGEDELRCLCFSPGELTVGHLNTTDNPEDSVCKCNEKDDISDDISEARDEDFISCDLINLLNERHFIGPKTDNDSKAIIMLCSPIPTTATHWYQTSPSSLMPTEHQTSAVTTVVITTHLDSETTPLRAGGTSTSSTSGMNTHESTGMTERTVATLAPVTSATESTTGSTHKGQLQNKPTEKTLRKNTVKIMPFTMDYDDYYDTHGKDADHTLCDYDRCRHLQMPCAELARIHNCLCPGLSADTAQPDPPKIAGVSEITQTSAQVSWCSPTSVVSQYQLKIEQEGEKQEIDNIDPSFRIYTIDKLLAGKTYSICVKAKNTVGASQDSCTKFTTHSNNMVYIYALAAASALLLLIVCVLSICLYKQCRHPSLGTPHLINLMSIPNPGFCDPVEKQETPANAYKIQHECIC